MNGQLNTTTTQLTSLSFPRRAYIYIHTNLYAIYNPPSLKEIYTYNQINQSRSHDYILYIYYNNPYKGRILTKLPYNT